MGLVDQDYHSSRVYWGQSQQHGKQFLLEWQGIETREPIIAFAFQVVDALTRMFVKASDKLLIKGLAHDLCLGGFINLQYANDTILFVDSGHSMATNLKWILTCLSKYQR